MLFESTPIWEKPRRHEVCSTPCPSSVFLHLLTTLCWWRYCDPHGAVSSVISFSISPRQGSKAFGYSVPLELAKQASPPREQINSAHLSCASVCGSFGLNFHLGCFTSRETNCPITRPTWCGLMDTGRIPMRSADLIRLLTAVESLHRPYRTQCPASDLKAPTLFLHNLAPTCDASSLISF